MREGKISVEGGKQVRDSFLVFGHPAIEEDEIEEVVVTLRSGWLGTGPKVTCFEEIFKVECGLMRMWQM